MSYEVKINGRRYWFNKLQNLKRISKSKWTVERHGQSIITYTIEGGKAAGGTSRDWWLEGGDFNGAIDCTSLVDALNCLEKM